jgi:hypothetical protein
MRRLFLIALIPAAAHAARSASHDAETAPDQGHVGVAGGVIHSPNGIMAVAPLSREATATGPRKLGKDG